MRLLFIIILFATIFSCARKSDSTQTNVTNKDTLIVTDNIVLDSLDFNVLKSDTSFEYVFPKTFKSADLTENEIKQCEVLLISYIANYNSVEAKRRFNQVTKDNPNLEFDLEDFTINLRNYGRQFVAAVSENGSKIVFVNCFCDPEHYDYRKTKLVEVFDGGKCFFNLKINLTEKEVFDFRANGAA